MLSCRVAEISQNRDLDRDRDLDRKSRRITSRQDRKEAQRGKTTDYCILPSFP